MTDLSAEEARWADWIEDACAAVGIEPESVDIRGVHVLTRQIAHGFERPMAPVGAYILGVAVGCLQEQGRPVDLESMRRAIADTIRDHGTTEEA